MDKRLGKTYRVIDTQIPPNELGAMKLIKKLGPGHFLALKLEGNPWQWPFYRCDRCAPSCLRQGACAQRKYHVYSCQLREEIT